MRLVFAGTPAVAVPSLRALAAGPHEIAAVVTYTKNSWSNKTGQLVPYGIKMVQADLLPDTFASNQKVCIIDEIQQDRNIQPMQ